LRAWHENEFLNNLLVGFAFSVFSCKSDSTVIPEEEYECTICPEYDNEYRFTEFELQQIDDLKLSFLLV
jgi:hypothetical protein